MTRAESTRRGCREMTSAFQQLPQLYPSSKFCVISAAEVGTSLKFKMEALPAILVYKGTLPSLWGIGIR